MRMPRLGAPVSGAVNDAADGAHALAAAQAIEHAVDEADLLRRIDAAVLAERQDVVGHEVQLGQHAVVGARSRDRSAWPARS